MFVAANQNLMLLHPSIVRSTRLYVHGCHHVDLVKNINQAVVHWHQFMDTKKVHLLSNYRSSLIPSPKLFLAFKLKSRHSAIWEFSQTLVCPLPPPKCMGERERRRWPTIIRPSRILPTSITQKIDMEPRIASLTGRLLQGKLLKDCPQCC